MTRPRTIIVTDGEQRAALATVRSLGRTGYRCVVVSSSRPSLAGTSRFVAKSYCVPDCLKQPVEFANSLVALAAAEKADLVLPVSEAAILALLPIRDRLRPAEIPFPELSQFEAISDKRRLLSEASRLGISVPLQYVLEKPGDLESLNLDGVGFPMVIKPARSVNGHAGARTKFTVSYATNAADLLRKVSRASPQSFPLLLQQRISGPGIGIFLLLWSGETRAQFGHKRLCEKPPSGGISVYRESVAVDSELAARSRALLESFRWQGVAMVEYKRDQRTGATYLMEINGRLWGSLQLAIDAGVDFPTLLVRSALNESVTPQLEYGLGVRSRWWWGQVDHLIGRARRKAHTPPLPTGTRSAGRVVGDMVLGMFRAQDYEEILRWNDPAPFATETLQWITALR
ncbi:MAG: ATP-grasp domain-containing protein [Gemmatimonadaceae bacterium]